MLLSPEERHFGGFHELVSDVDPVLEYDSLAKGLLRHQPFCRPQVRIGFFFFRKNARGQAAATHDR